MAVKCHFPIQLTGGIECRAFRNWINAASGDITAREEEGNLKLASGHNKFKTAILPTETLLFEIPEVGKDKTAIPLSHTFMTHLSHAMTSIEGSSIQSKTGWVTMKIDKNIEFYSTNQATITRINTVIPCGDSDLYGTYLLPVNFCKMMLRLVRDPEKEELRIDENNILIVNTETNRCLYSRLGAVDAYGLDYDNVISSSLEAFAREDYFLIPKTLDEDMKLRVNLFFDKMKSTKISVVGKELSILTRDSNNELDNSFVLEENVKESEGNFHAANILKGMTLGEYMAFNEQVMVITDDPDYESHRFTFLVAAV